MFQNQCQLVHKDLLAGTCPWCGCAIINGQVVSLPPQWTPSGFAVAVVILIRMLKDENLRSAAADALGRLGPDAKTAVPALTELLNSKDEDIRKAASEALEKITEISARWSARWPAEPEPEDVLATDYLLAIIEDCGRHAVKAIPLLRVALKDRDWSVRFAAENALARIGPSAKEAISELRLLLQDKDQLVRDAAEEAIKSIDR